MTRTTSHPGSRVKGRRIEPAGHMRLGHRQLSIASLSTGHEPIQSRNDQCVLNCLAAVIDHGHLRPGPARANADFLNRTEREKGVCLVAEIPRPSENARNIKFDAEFPLHGGSGDEWNAIAAAVVSAPGLPGESFAAGPVAARAFADRDFRMENEAVYYARLYAEGRA